MNYETPVYAENPLIASLIELDLPTDSYVVFGSAPMWANGIPMTMKDLDLIAMGGAWEKAATLAPIETAEMGGRVIRFHDLGIEIFDGWAPGNWDIEELIRSADIINGIPFVQIQHVLNWKKIMNRPKDAEHIRLIEEFCINMWG